MKLAFIEKLFATKPRLPERLTTYGIIIADDEVWKSKNKPRFKVGRNVWAWVAEELCPGKVISISTCVRSCGTIRHTDRAYRYGVRYLSARSSHEITFYFDVFNMFSDAEAKYMIKKLSKYLYH